MVARLVCKGERRDHSLRDACSVLVQVDRPAAVGFSSLHHRRFFMQWTTPTATDLRFGFEITMYVSAR